MPSVGHGAKHETSSDCRQVFCFLRYLDTPMRRFDGLREPPVQAIGKSKHTGYGGFLDLVSDLVHLLDVAGRVLAGFPRFPTQAVDSREQIHRVGSYLILATQGLGDL
ncbi:MAG: hypothetical protein IH808_08120 [Proteobacteria bacterium]|nr:hypothetical protein [Pseudomonadota bacterium]